MTSLLKTLLEPLRPFLKIKNLKELSILREKEVGLEIEGKGYTFVEVQELNYAYWKMVCHVLANMSGLIFDLETHPILSTSFQDPETKNFHRFEAMLGPFVKDGISISIRLHRTQNKTFKDFGMTDSLIEKVCNSVRCQKSILISGGTSSGKTTFLNLLAQEIPLSKRILTVEDTRELNLPHKNWKSYLVPRGEENGCLTYQAVIDHFMRSRPDIILTGEVSIRNSFPILRLLNTGHKGFMCTIHANSPKLALASAFEQNLNLSGYKAENVFDFLKKTIDLVIQIESRDADKKRIQSIWEREESTVGV
ncbi:MAG: Flp pilus assembly complex ATPase component TadA [Proteobacteria bacterium]|nr:Flp pilus assembly complex ATPase component TadA [Pseudomonadota bacterium]